MKFLIQNLKNGEKVILIITILEFFMIHNYFGGDNEKQFDFSS